MVNSFSKRKPSLLTAWMIGHLIFAAGMVFAPFVSSLRSATVIVAVCGIPWALACWAPFTFMGVEINRLGSNPSNLPTNNALDSSYIRIPDTSVELDMEPSVLHLRHSSTSPSSTSTATAPAPTGELAGVYLGILNLYTTLPQFIATGISMVVFTLLEPGKSPELAKDAHPDEHHGTEGPNAIAVCLFIGAIASVVAAYATRRLRFVR